MSSVPGTNLSPPSSWRNSVSAIAAVGGYGWSAKSEAARPRGRTERERQSLSAQVASAHHVGSGNPKRDRLSHSASRLPSYGTGGGFQKYKRSTGRRRLKERGSTAQKTGAVYSRKATVQQGGRLLSACSCSRQASRPEGLSVPGAGGVISYESPLSLHTIKNLAGSVEASSPPLAEVDSLETNYRMR
jgi:hypothetical protein